MDVEVDGYDNVLAVDGVDAHGLASHDGIAVAGTLLHKVAVGAGEHVFILKLEARDALVVIATDDADDVARDLALRVHALLHVLVLKARKRDKAGLLAFEVGRLKGRFEVCLQQRVGVFGKIFVLRVARADVGIRACIATEHLGNEVGGGVDRIVVLHHTGVNGDVDGVDRAGEHVAVAVVNGTAPMGQREVCRTLLRGVRRNLARLYRLKTEKFEGHGKKSQAEDATHHRFTGIGRLVKPGQGMLGKLAGHAVLRAPGAGPLFGRNGVGGIVALRGARPAGTGSGLGRVAPGGAAHPRFFIARGHGYSVSAAISAGTPDRSTSALCSG